MWLSCDSHVTQYNDTEDTNAAHILTYIHDKEQRNKHRKIENCILLHTIHPSYCHPHTPSSHFLLTFPPHVLSSQSLLTFPPYTPFSNSLLTLHTPLSMQRFTPSPQLVSCVGGGERGEFNEVIQACEKFTKKPSILECMVRWDRLLCVQWMIRKYVRKGIEVPDSLD